MKRDAHRNKEFLKAEHWASRGSAKIVMHQLPAYVLTAMQPSLVHVSLAMTGWCWKREGESQAVNDELCSGSCSRTEGDSPSSRAPGAV